jgi:hypothetical protein
MGSQDADNEVRMGPKKKVFKSEWVESGAVNIEDTQPLLPQ